MRQLLEAGLSRAQVRGLVRKGWLIRRHTGVFAVGHVPRSRPSRWSAAVLALGDEALLGYRAAAAAWEILRGAVPTEVVVPPTSGKRSRDGVLVHRCHVALEHRGRRAGIPVTSVVRTLLDLASVVRLRTLARAFEEAQIAHGLPPEALGAEVICRRRYRGNARLRAVLHGAVDPDGVRSLLELRFLRLCDVYGIPRPLVNERLGIWTPDFLWPEHALVVETDGVRFHRTAAARRRDAEKDASLRAMGLEVVRLTWADVVERRPATAADLLARMTSDS